MSISLEISWLKSHWQIGNPVNILTYICIWTWVRAGSVSWWWTGNPGMLQSTGSQRVGHYWATELMYTCMYMHAQSLHSGLTLCDSMNCSPPASSVHVNSQARILEWLAISFSRVSFHPRDQTCVSALYCRVSLPWNYQGSRIYTYTCIYIHIHV